MAVAIAIGSACAVGSASAATKYRSVNEALEQGLSAVGGGYAEMAEPALQYVVKNGGEDAALLARYYLARIYADNNGARTDHARAYELFQRIADDYADLDPDGDRRTMFVSKSLIALAGYLRRGMPELKRAPNARRAAEYLRHAATVFGDEDAQFELAKMLLMGEGIEADPGLANHWLATLSQKGHVGAQAFLADLYWRGKYVEKDPVRALALITIALANAPPGERVWIEDIYQNIYCGTPEGVRSQATGLVANWRTRYSRKPSLHTRDSLGSLTGEAIRTCNDGSPVARVASPLADPGRTPARAPVATTAPPLAPVAETLPPAASPPAFARGSTLGSTLGLGFTGGTGATYAPAGGDR